MKCGSWLVRDGQVVAVDRDDWVGLLTNRDPRTAIGVKHDGKVVACYRGRAAAGIQCGTIVEGACRLFADFGD